MSAADDSDIFVPSVFVGQTAGQIILYDYMYQNGELRDENFSERSLTFVCSFKGFALVLNDDFPFNINTHLIIPFCIVVGLCFIIMVSHPPCVDNEIPLNSRFVSVWLYDCPMCSRETPRDALPPPDQLSQKARVAEIHQK